MNKKVLMLTTVAIVALLTSSMIAVSQAWWFKKPKPEYVGYDFKAILGTLVLTVNDTSGAPSRIVWEGYRAPEGVIQCNVTINGKVYYYPDDFDYYESFYYEMNLIIRKGLIRVEVTLTFKNLPGHPTLKEWLVTEFTNIGTPEATFHGVFELTGTRMFNKVEGFGLDTGYYIQRAPPILYARHFGFIKGWPL